MNNNNDNTIKIIYDKFKILLSGCNHIADAYELSVKFIDKYPGYDKLIYGMVHGKNYSNELSMQSFHSIIGDISKLEYSEEVGNLVDNKCNENRISDIQKRTFMRLRTMKKNKPYNPYNPTYKLKLDGEITKNCPHCNNERKDKFDAVYVICGYKNVRGYDNNGCRKDWCFRCGKKLCKNWIDHSLFVKANCVHNKTCCVQYAFENSLNYNKDMCQCNNKEPENDFKHIENLIDTLGKNRE